MKKQMLPAVVPAPFADVTGVILAGGLSRRMGRDKATLRLDGQTLVERLASVMAALFPHLLIAGERPDLERAGLPCVADRFPGSALGGLCTALEAAPTPYVFAVPCDLPFPDAGLMRLLVERRHGADAVVIQHAGGCEPLFAVYAKSCLPAMLAQLASGEARIQALYPQLRVHVVGEAELPRGWERSLLNLNCPDDLSRLEPAARGEGVEPC